MMTSAGAGMLARQLRAHLLADVVDVAAADDGVGPGEVDVLEDAGSGRTLGEGTVALDAVGRDRHDLAVLDLAHEFGADNVERAGLRRQHVGRADPAQHQRPDADRITRADQHVVGEARQSVGAFDLHQGVDEALDDAAPLGARDKVEDHLGVRGRLADGTRGDQVAAQRKRIGEIAVVGNGKAASVEVGEQGLHVAQDRVAGGGVAIVPERDVALEPADHVGLVEVVPHKAQAALGVEMPRRRT